MLLARGNLARQMLLPDMIDFVDPNFDPGPKFARSTTASCEECQSQPRPPKKIPEPAWPSDRAMANVLADKEDFNTRYGSLNGWREAVRKVKPTLRVPAQFSLSTSCPLGATKTTTEVVDVMLGRFLSVPLAEKSRLALIGFLDNELGTSDIGRARPIWKNRCASWFTSS